MVRSGRRRGSGPAAARSRSPGSAGVDAPTRGLREAFTASVDGAIIRTYVRTRPAIIHVDMDAFFASVEQARRPELRGLPVVIGGRRERRSVVSAASYEARAFGVRSAMPVAQAERLCPQAVFLPGDMPAYVAVHRRLDEALPAASPTASRSSPSTRRSSTSPAAGGCSGHRGRSPAACRSLVYQTEGITCSVGIGPNKLLAKLAANLHKPAGLGELSRRRRRRAPARAAGARARRHRPGRRAAPARARPDHGRHAARRPARVPCGGVRSVGGAAQAVWRSGAACRRSTAARGAEVDGSRDHVRLRHRRPPGCCTRRCSSSPTSS